jgi:hypothetical protein
MSEREHYVRDWLQIVRGEYLEIPGLRLTERQVQRLWGLDSRSCHAILSALLEEDFLKLTADGCFVRRDAPRA